MKTKTIYELGDQVKVIGVPVKHFGTDLERFLGKVLTVSETVANSRWIDEEFVTLHRINSDEHYGFSFEYYTPPIMQYDEFRVGQVVKCVATRAAKSWNFKVGELYKVGTDGHGDTSPIEPETGYAFNFITDRDLFDFILVSQEPLSTSDPELDAAKAEIVRLEALVSQKTEEILQLRNAIGRVEDIFSEI